jgi:hypothetical protein
MSNPVITIGGSTRTSNVRKDSLVIVDELNEAPNTCSFSCDGFTPTIGQEVVITLGGTKEFGGHLTRIVQRYEAQNRANVAFECQAVDYTRLLDRRKVTKRYTATSASSIVTDIISSFTTGFTTAGVVGGLPTIDEIDFTFEDVSRALSRVASLAGGYWYVDYDRDLHFFITEATSTPDDITDVQHTHVHDIALDTDASQQRTRTLVEGGGGSLTQEIAPGDTEIRVDDLSWYDPSGGTVVIGPQRVTYASAGVVYERTNQWDSQSAAGTHMDWFSVTWAAALGLFVATSSGSTQVMTSPDAVTWTARTGIGSGNWYSVTWSPDVSLLVAVEFATTPRIMTSPDGITWTSRTVPGGITRLWDVAWSPSLGLFVAVCDSGTNRVITSPDGISWTARTGISQEWHAVTWAAGLGIFVAIASFNASTNCVMTSSDGINWTQRTGAAQRLWNAVAWSPELGLLVAVGGDISSNDGIMTSPDGVTWTLRSAPTGGWQAVVWAPALELFCAVGRWDTYVTVMTSPDGINWSVQVPPGTARWEGVTWSPDLGLLVAVGTTDGLEVMTNAPIPHDALAGIPPSGAGEILYAMPVGTNVNMVVTRDDTSAQAALAAIEGGDGIHEHYIQDRRLALSTCEALGDADLGLYASAQETLEFVSRDTKLRSGKSITINIGAPNNIAGTFTIQRVVSSEYGMPSINPRRQVSASSFRFTLDDVFRRLVADA